MENHIEIEETEKNKGFTLVELLIVIVILGILATVTVFAVTGITNKGKTSACQSDSKTIETAEEAYSANHGNYVANQQSLVDDGLMHSKSTKINVFLVPVGAGVAATNGPDGIAGNADDTPALPASAVASYTLAGINGTDCAGMTF
jgi:prepilin-type N-terminal cleavage/methylation domain-containing protein